MLHLIADVLKNSYLVTSLVLIMMIMIEYINVASSGKILDRLHSSKPRQVVLGALLGAVPGCLGGFASVSLYAHGMISFGALIAAMVSSSGDEAFIMLAMIPKQAVILFGVLFLLAIGIGMLTDLLFKGGNGKKFSLAGKDLCDMHFEIHKAHDGEFPKLFRLSSYKGLTRPSPQLIVLLLGVALFIFAVFSGNLEHSHGMGEAAGHVHEHVHEHAAGFNIFSEEWMMYMFAGVSVIVLFLLAASSEHFLKEHIWNHVILKHALKIFLWTASALLIIQVGLHYVHIDHWIRDNVFLMILLASLVGMIPESGPHLIFVTLFAGGYVPFSVLLASSISQDGHTSLPLLASSRRSFLIAKLLNALFAIAVGSIAFLFGF